MHIIDLTQEIYPGMDVYPGDPEVESTQIHALDTHGWRLRSLLLHTHIGTHVNVPFHMVEDGKTLDEISLDRFQGTCHVYKPGMTFMSDSGVIFAHHPIDASLSKQLIKTPPKFIGVSSKYEFDIGIERLLLEHEIISFENLEHTDMLPESFSFFGLPLRLRGADGSPVRAIAIVD